jgi:hypothetical protein
MPDRVLIKRFLFLNYYILATSELCSIVLKMLQLALLNRVPFGKFNRASAFPVATRPELVDRSCCRELQMWRPKE